MLFQSTLSLRRATGLPELAQAFRDTFQSTLSLRRATTFYSKEEDKHEEFQSTLSLRRATSSDDYKIAAAAISIHALLAESDLALSLHETIQPKFQSTLSLRRATLGQNISQRGYHHFNPRSPCGERPLLPVVTTVFAYFNPRSPCGERLVRHRRHAVLPVISIHALLAESDPRHPAAPAESRDFNPRSPCGERREAEEEFGIKCRFQSTLSLRRATGTFLGIISQASPFQSTLSLRRATFGVHGIN